MPTCKVCGAELKPGGARGLCPRCYQRERRGLPPTAEHEKAAPGEAERITFSIERTHKQTVAGLAEAEGVSQADWCRTAVLERIGRLNRKRKGGPS